MSSWVDKEAVMIKQCHTNTEPRHFLDLLTALAFYRCRNFSSLDQEPFPRLILDHLSFVLVNYFHGIRRKLNVQMH